MPVAHVLLPLKNQRIRQISDKIEDGGTRGSQICPTEKHAKHEALNDSGQRKHREEEKQNEAIRVLHNTTGL